MPSELYASIKSVSTISGTDIVVYLEDTQIIAARSIRVNVTRAKQPVYVHGTANPLGFGRGHRLITGIMESALIYQANISEWFKQKQAEVGYEHYALGDVRNMDVLKDLYGAGDEAGKIAGTFAVNKYKPLFLDELPPIDITVVGVNELGKTATMRIYGVEFTDYTTSTAVENVINVETLSFVAVHFEPWTLGDVSSGGGTTTTELDLGGIPV